MQQLHTVLHPGRQPCAIPTRTLPLLRALAGIDLICGSEFTSILDFLVTLEGAGQSNTQSSRKMLGSVGAEAVFNFTIASLINDVNFAGIILVPNNEGFERARAALSQDKLDGDVLSQVCVCVVACVRAFVHVCASVHVCVCACVC